MSSQLPKNHPWYSESHKLMRQICPRWIECYDKAMFQIQTKGFWGRFKRLYAWLIGDYK